MNGGGKNCTLHGCYIVCAAKMHQWRFSSCLPAGLDSERSHTRVWHTAIQLVQHTTLQCVVVVWGRWSRVCCSPPLSPNTSHPQSDSPYNRTLVYIPAGATAVYTTAHVCVYS